MRSSFIRQFASIVPGIALICGAALPQSAGPTFDVTSVKPRKGMNPFQPGFAQKMKFGCSAGGRFVSTGYLLIKSVSWGWDVPEFWISGMPAWAGAGSPEAYFDLEATAEAPATPEQCKRMVQAMLADRFKLALHRETRLVSVDALVQSKEGTKLKKITETDVSTADSGVVLNGRAMHASAEDGMRARGMTMAQLANLISYTTGKIDGRVVIDQTGLEGRYEVHLDFNQFPASAMLRDKPDVFTAVQQQLGLRLESRRQPVDMIVVDHIEKPSEN